MSDMPPAPMWKWEWNINTVALLFGFAAGIAAWGGTWQRINAAVDNSQIIVERLSVRIDAMENHQRRLDNHELRIEILERRSADTLASIRASEIALNALSADVRVMKEILQRIEASNPRP